MVRVCRLVASSSSSSSSSPSPPPPPPPPPQRYYHIPADQVESPSNTAPTPLVGATSKQHNPKLTTVQQKQPQQQRNGSLAGAAVFQQQLKIGMGVPARKKRSYRDYGFADTCGGCAGKGQAHTCGARSGLISLSLHFLLTETETRVVADCIALPGLFSHSIDICLIRLCTLVPGCRSCCNGCPGCRLDHAPRPLRPFACTGRLCSVATASGTRRGNWRRSERWS